jgi:ribosomal protein S18 acetylase RimI-like enzyme
MENLSMTGAAPKDLDLPDDQTIRCAVDSEIITVGQILGSAFSNDPVMRWLCGRENLGGLMFQAEAESHYKHHNHVYINESQTGAALWLPPGVSPTAPFSWGSMYFMWRLLLSGGIKGMHRGYGIEQVMSSKHLKEPHFYLHAIGAHLDHQGKGIGSALLKAGLSACDQIHAPAYLESTNIRNNALYERYGFEITGDYEFRDEGPTVWFMRRPPRI